MSGTGIADGAPTEGDGASMPFPSRRVPIVVTVVGILLLAFVGPACLAIGVLAAVPITNALADDLQRIDPTGSITLEEGTTASLYLSGFGSRIGPGCTVTGPDGSDVPVELATSVDRREFGGHTYVFVGTIEATVSGAYEFACDGSDLGGTNFTHSRRRSSGRPSCPSRSGSRVRCSRASRAHSCSWSASFDSRA